MEKINTYIEKIKKFFADNPQIKAFFSYVRDLAARHPLVTIAIVILIGLLIWAYLPSWTDDREEIIHNSRQTETKQKVENLKRDAVESAVEGKSEKSAAEASERKLETTQKRIKEKRKNVQEKTQKTKDSGHSDIDDSDVPSNIEICLRAKQLGIRCDLDG